MSAARYTYGAVQIYSIVLSISINLIDVYADTFYSLHCNMMKYNKFGRKRKMRRYEMRTLTLHKLFGSNGDIDNKINPERGH
jgi:hypothetical protein